MKRRKTNKKPTSSTPAAYWLYGKHACFAALKNPKRKILRVLITSNTFNTLEDNNITTKNPEITSASTIESNLHQDAVHQGIAVYTSPLPEMTLDDINLDTATGPLIILDQISDPHNIGAILRSAAAFGAAAVLVTDRNSPSETATMAKSASGALDIVPLIRIQNMVQSLDHLKKHEYWCVGLDGNTSKTIDAALEFSKVAYIMGAEGKGMRTRTREHCDLLVRLPINEAMESLNVSNAAAIVLYELSKVTKSRRKTP